MSNVWLSTIYFPKVQELPMDLIADLVNRLAKWGLEYPPPAGAIWYSSPDSWYAEGVYLEDVPTYIEGIPLEEALRLTKQYQCGQISLYDHTTETTATLGFELCGMPTWNEKTAEHHYGSIHLTVDYAYLHRDPADLIRQRYLQIFRWCNTIAKTKDAIYGWGDLEYSILDGGYPVPKSALEEWHIPRIAWWNYFSDEYVTRLGENLLGSAGPWMTLEQEGIILILRPPGELSYPSMSEYREMFPD
jgi:hypothetical protein